ncbi:MAG: prolipoprotein diacylglyceryl transferase [Propionibacteriaceae bacterium]|jgi:prolipoprotein diacylglyceryl transferase|nr:prolipoprotein diacylglyceryl transferase [Propionibacteriaceae bacterium]
MDPLFLPSPSQGVWHLGPVPIRAYALCVLAGVVAAWFATRTRWRARGGDTEKLENLLLVTIIAGICGARLYFVLIEWPRFFGPDGTWFHVFYIWEGGLGIWGGVSVGALAAFLMARFYRFRFSVLADCIAPALPLAQAVGRLGNWWNQELYGRPTTLPWGIEIDPAHRVAGYGAYETFHPTFLYEMVWDLATAAFLLFVGERRLKLGRGKLFAAYVVCYAAGRFVVESFRIDPVHVYGSLRVNAWVTLVFGLAGLAALIWFVVKRPGGNGPAAAAVPAGESWPAAETGAPGQTVEAADAVALAQQAGQAEAGEPGQTAEAGEPGQTAEAVEPGQTAETVEPGPIHEAADAGLAVGTEDPASDATGEGATRSQDNR